MPFCVGSAFLAFSLFDLVREWFSRRFIFSELFLILNNDFNRLMDDVSCEFQLTFIFPICYKINAQSVLEPCLVFDISKTL